MPRKKVKHALCIGGMTDRWHRFIRVGPLIQQVLRWHDIDVTLTENANDLKKEHLAGYDLVINYTTRREATADQIEGIKEHLVDGGGHIALHGATTGFGDDYFELVGAQFIKHPPLRPFQVEVIDGDHDITRGLPRRFDVQDEPYILDIRSDFHLLMEAHVDDETIPIAWTKEIGEGRLFHLSLGHDLEQWRHPLMQYMLVRAAQWCLGTSQTF